jgi:hypothetical protein
MSKKNTKTKASKADTKSKAKGKAKADAGATAAPPAEAATNEVATTETTPADAPAGGATGAAAAATPATQTQSTELQIKKDAKGRFWVVPKDGGAEQGPYETKKAAQDAKVAIASGATPAPAADETKPAKSKMVKEPKAKRVSAIDAAAQVLAASAEPMSCVALVEAMATQGLWESPGGRTPHATLYSAIIREIASKGNDSRFVKKDRGMFAVKA